MYDTLQLSILGLWAGAAWGAVAYLLGSSAFGPAIWPGVLSSPLIGLLVARLTHPGFARSTGLWRALWALASLYIGAVLFSLPISVREVIVRGARSSAPFEVALEPLLAVLWGVTVTWFVLVLWPLAYLTHSLVDWRLS